jgi:hypothetical protein
MSQHVQPENFQRDCMAPDTEPTDEELAVVMREAGEVARQRKKEGEAWLARQMEIALAAALSRPVRP